MKKTAKENLKMKNFSEETKLARKTRHSHEDESTRISGFTKALDHKNQLKRDYKHRVQDLKKEKMN